jgi:hypothetical protein
MANVAPETEPVVDQALGEAETSPPREVVLRGLFHFLHERRLKKLEKLERRNNFKRSLAKDALEYAGVEIDPVDMALDPMPPKNLKQRVQRRRVEKRAIALKPSREQADGLARIRQNMAEKAPYRSHKTEVTAEWVKYRKRQLKDELEAGEITSFEYRERVTHLNEIKPKRFLKIFKQPYAHKHYRPAGLPEQEAKVPKPFWPRLSSKLKSEDPKAWPPLTKYEKQTSQKAEALEQSIYSLTDQARLERKLERLRKSGPRKLARTQRRQEKWQNRKARVGSVLGKVGQQAKEVLKLYKPSTALKMAREDLADFRKWRASRREQKREKQVR